MHGTFYTHALADVSIFALARAHPTVPLAVRAAGVSMKVTTACNVRSRAALPPRISCLIVHCACTHERVIYCRIVSRNFDICARPQSQRLQSCSVCIYAGYESKKQLGIAMGVDNAY